MPDMSRSAGSRGPVRRLYGRFSLRTKLISAVLVMVTIALAAISFAGISVLSRYLLGQADTQLKELTTGYSLQNLQNMLENTGPGYQRGEAITYVPINGQPRQLVLPIALSGIGRKVPPRTVAGPQIPSKASSLPDSADQATTLGAKDGGKWRVVGIPVLNADKTLQVGTLVVGLDVTSTYDTIGELTGIDLIVSLVILVGIAVLGFAAVRASLRPLTDIERTAEAIAAGDLARRVPDRDPRTEVGRLGRSLNTMLAQIEAGFHARAQSETAARRSEDRMRQFVADASHELRTPLTAIRGFAEYYRQRGGIAPAELDRIMRRVEQESSRMGVLVEDMLLLARLDQQRPLERRPVDLLTLAADAVHDARVVAPSRNINLTVGGDTALIVLGDEVRLRQIIGNLMSNALTHTPDGTPIDVRVRTGRIPEQFTAGPHPGQAAPAAPPAVIFEVADQGTGLTPEQASHVFERFYRADQARTRQAGGTGLGLAIVAALVAAHGGLVWVDSVPGQGATFRIALPLAPEARPSEPDSGEAAPPPDLIGSASSANGTGPASDTSSDNGTSSAGSAGPADRTGPSPANGSERAQPIEAT
jgi:two-component system OmpR family sensor kinase